MGVSNNRKLQKRPQHIVILVLRTPTESPQNLKTLKQNRKGCIPCTLCSRPTEGQTRGWPFAFKVSRSRMSESRQPSNRQHGNNKQSSGLNYYQSSTALRYICGMMLQRCYSHMGSSRVSRNWSIDPRFDDRTSQTTLKPAVQSTRLVSKSQSRRDQLRWRQQL